MNTLHNHFTYFFVFDVCFVVVCAQVTLLIIDKSLYPALPQKNEYLFLIIHVYVLPLTCWPVDIFAFQLYEWHCKKLINATSKC